MSAVLSCGTPMMFRLKCEPLGARLPVNEARPSGESDSGLTEPEPSEQARAPTIKSAPASRVHDTQAAPRAFLFQSIVNSFAPQRGRMTCVGRRPRFGARVPRAGNVGLAEIA